MPDPTEPIRRQRLVEINAAPGSREALEAKYGQVWDTQQLAEEFEVIGFMAPLVVVRRKADGVKGSIEFQHQPRFYFGFQAHQGELTMPKFMLGQLVSTPGALEALQESGQTPEFFLNRHVQSDWGEVDAEDWKLNDQALHDGSRLLSAYRTLKGKKIWVITEATDDQGHRAATTILLPDEY